jgi:tRNA-dihydrouridine synthase 3
VSEATSVSPFAGRLWLAPLTVGGNLPFRRLCVSFGAEVTVGEMAVVRRLRQGRGAELALLRSHAEEPCFGAQIADNKPESLAEGARLAEERGARFVDLNCGCPIDTMTRRGLGASLLQRPARLARLVEAMRTAVSVPVTVKLRLGFREGQENVSEVARACEEAGAAAITIHGRTREQRYSRAADWGAIGRVAAERGVPVIGNGDLLTHYEVRERRALSGVTSVMLARGALIKPWLFREIHEKRSWEPTPAERVGVLYRLLELLRDHFGTHERARERAARFLAWHQGFFCRYRPLPEAEYALRAREHPLLQTRLPEPSGEGPLGALLADARSDTHAAIAATLLDCTAAEEAAARLKALAATLPAAAAAVEPQSFPVQG